MPNQPAIPSGASLIASSMRDLVAVDPELKGRIRELANKALEFAEWTLDNGDMTSRMHVARGFLPAMVQAAAASDDAERIAALEETIQDMRREMRQNFGSGRIQPPDTPAATEDTPTFTMQPGTP